MQKFEHNVVVYLVADAILRSNKVWGSRKWIKSIDVKLYYAHPKMHMWVVTVYLLII